MSIDKANSSSSGGNGVKEKINKPSNITAGTANTSIMTESTTSIVTVPVSASPGNVSVRATDSAHQYPRQLFETRQFDYKRGSKNTLFVPTEENHRIRLLKSLPITENHTENSQHLLQDVNKELKSIISERGTSGCSCKHIKVDKLSVTKMKAELLSHGSKIQYMGSSKDIDALSKAELSSLVREVVKHCSLCIDNSCECVALGIPCSAQLCGCMRGGHGKAGHAQSCENPSGKDQFDGDRVSEYRRRVLFAVTKEEGDVASAIAAIREDCCSLNHFSTVPEKEIEQANRPSSNSSSKVE